MIQERKMAQFHAEEGGCVEENVVWNVYSFESANQRIAYNMSHWLQNICKKEIDVKIQKTKHSRGVLMFSTKLCL